MDRLLHMTDSSVDSVQWLPSINQFTWSLYAVTGW